MPEIGPPGSESGGRKRAHGNRTAARLRKHRMSHRPPYRLRASPRLYTNLGATPTFPQGLLGRERFSLRRYRANVKSCHSAVLTSLFPSCCSETGFATRRSAKAKARIVTTVALAHRRAYLGLRFRLIPMQRQRSTSASPFLGVT